MSSSRDMKRCPGCGETKPLEDFHVDRRKRDGRCTRCKSCSSARKRARWADPAIRASESEENRRWHRENPERNSQRTRRWSDAHGRAYYAARKALGVPTPGSAAYHLERLIVLERADGACGICGEDVDPFDFCTDHIIPTSRGGTHCLSNLQAAHRRCNSEKATAMPGER